MPIRTLFSNEGHQGRTRIRVSVDERAINKINTPYITAENNEGSVAIDVEIMRIAIRVYDDYMAKEKERDTESNG